jgi:hypothetical protein
MQQQVLVAIIWKEAELLLVLVMIRIRNIILILMEDLLILDLLHMLITELTYMVLLVAQVTEYELFKGYAPKSTMVYTNLSEILSNAPTYVADFGMVITNNSYGDVVGNCDYMGY